MMIDRVMAYFPTGTEYKAVFDNGDTPLARFFGTKFTSDIEFRSKGYAGV